ncbi:glutathione gamma-glutamylcysteinyltransferase 1-like [Dorcoceras hygrometricum]|uniref:Glutathione gamma-glutamylcysteinyltransferase 1-like n=1 Tax=Dorcoceras hygrometricum TaxID=472368 RepID=A0A2Z7CTR5_9LAMI|nr:glutathione gamma-glutamylcysteinyltransferase 1-like [Dorcoceras hygrometricum]
MMVSGPQLFRCQRLSTVLCRQVRFDDFRCDQDLRSVSGICSKSGHQCYVVLISKSDVVLVSETHVSLEIRSELALADADTGYCCNRRSEVITANRNELINRIITCTIQNLVSLEARHALS